MLATSELKRFCAAFGLMRTKIPQIIASARRISKILPRYFLQRKKINTIKMLIEIRKISVVDILNKIKNKN